MGTLTIKAKKTVQKVEEPKQVVAKPTRGRYFPMIRSRHPSHAGLRQGLGKLPFRSVIRMGSLTALEDPATKAGSRVELNPSEAIRNSSSKLKMKQCFDELKVKTAEWTTVNNNNDLEAFANKVGYPIVAKHHFGSRGTGNTLLKSSKEVKEFLAKHDRNLNHYIFEKYCNFNKEYRLHVTKDGCFYTCRKMLKQEFKDHPNAWQRHDDNCAWILEENPMFEKPVNWKEIEEHCVKALKSCGLDFGACDLRVQNATDEQGRMRNICDFIVVEINSAPSFGERTLQKYKEVLPQLLIKKHEGR